MTEKAQKQKATVAKSWRQEMQFNIENAVWELSFWINKPPATRTATELNEAVRLINDAKRIQAFANAISGDTLDNYVEEAIQEE